MIWLVEWKIILSESKVERERERERSSVSCTGSGVILALSRCGRIQFPFELSLFYFFLFSNNLTKLAPISRLLIFSLFFWWNSMEFSQFIILIPFYLNYTLLSFLFICFFKSTIRDLTRDFNNRVPDP